MVIELSLSRRLRRAGTWFTTGVEAAGLTQTPHQRGGSSLPRQRQVRAFYNGACVQSAITVTIMVNFVVSAAKSQLMFEDGLAVNQGTDLETLFWWSELIFAIIFVADLLVNLYGHFLWPFFNDAWNIFDCAVITVTLLSQFQPDMPMMSVLRLFRAFRAFRLFKRIPELHAIMAASLRSLPSVSHAFLILGLVMGIWSIMGVEFWTEDDFCAGLGEQLGDAGSCMDMFGQFSLAMLSMFQVTTFDSWSSGVTRPMVLSVSNAIMQIKISIFFVSYQFISAIIMMNVVVAILLDKFLSAPEDTSKKAIHFSGVDGWHNWAPSDLVERRLKKTISEVRWVVQAVEQDDSLIASMQGPIPEERAPWVAAPEGREKVGHEQSRARVQCVVAQLMSSSSAQEVAGLILDLKECISADTLQHSVMIIQSCVRGHFGRKKVQQMRVNRALSASSLETLASSSVILRAGSISELERLAYEIWLASTVREYLNEWKRWSGKFALPWQTQVRLAYESQASQITVAALIFVNFILSAAKAEMNPLSEDQETAFMIIEGLFGSLFAIELIVNMYGYFWLAFWINAWNIFDFCVVTVSSLALLHPNLPGVSVLRLFRAFRAFRLFKRMKGLRNIVVGVLRSLPRVSYAFVILMLIMGIWSIIAVELFGADFPDFFGNFLLSMLSLFQVMTFDAWTSQIARPVIVHMKRKSPMMGLGAAFFFATYSFAASIFMMNVVIAILIDKFLESAAEEKRKDEQAKRAGLAPSDRNTAMLMRLDFELQSQLIHLRDRLRLLHRATTGIEFQAVADGKVVQPHANGKQPH